MGEQKKHSIGVIFPDGRVETFTTYLSFCLQQLDEEKLHTMNQRATRYKTPFVYKDHFIGFLDFDRNKSKDTDLKRTFKYKINKHKL